jgi:hypothetical protein
MLYDPRWEKTLVITPRKSLRAILIESAARIEQRGLCTGDFLGCDGSLCTIGAIRESSPDTCAASRAERKLRRFLNVKCVPTWNDARYRTQSEVVAALRACSDG